MDSLALWLPTGFDQWKAQAGDRQDIEDEEGVFILCALPPHQTVGANCVPEDDDSCQVALSLTS